MLQFITHKTERFDEIEGAKKALEGGCRWIQLRIKDASATEIEEKGRLLSALCKDHGAKLILDDHVELVKTTGADGVHLGKLDMPLWEAREILGEDYIIGATANTFGDIRKAVAEGADYIGLGPFRYTSTKRNLSPILGLEGYRAIMAECGRHGLSIPIAAIGGLTIEDIPQLLDAGVTGVAVSGAILKSDDPVSYTRAIMSIIGNQNNNSQKTSSKIKN